MALPSSHCKSACRPESAIVFYKILRNGMGVSVEIAEDMATVSAQACIDTIYTFLHSIDREKIFFRIIMHLVTVQKY